MQYGIEELEDRLLKRKRYRNYVFLFLGIVLLLSVALNVKIGSVPVSLTDILNMHSRIAEIFWFLRLPRIILAVIVGISLSVAGSVMQSIFRNPMADPYLLGSSAGAGVGGAIGFLLGGGYLIEILSFVGAMLPAYLSYRLSMTKHGSSMLILVLAGIAISALLSSIITLMLFFAGNQLHNIFFWLMGSFGNANWNMILFSVFPVSISVIVITRRASEINAMTLGEETAISIGIDVEFLKKTLLVFSSLLVSSSVAMAGIIGFTGLVIPHIVRLLFGYDNRLVLPGSALLGAIFMIWADAISRTIISPAELPIGIVTSLIGAPFFMHLLLRKKRL